MRACMCVWFGANVCTHTHSLHAFTDCTRRSPNASSLHTTQTYHSCPLSILPPRDPNAKDAPSSLWRRLWGRLISLLRLESWLQDDEWSFALYMANP